MWCSLSLSFIRISLGDGLGCFGALRGEHGWTGYGWLTNTCEYWAVAEGGGMCCLA